MTETLHPNDPEFDEIHKHCVEMYKLKRIASGEISKPDIYLKFSNDEKILGNAGLFFAGPGKSRALLPCEEWFDIKLDQESKNTIRSEAGRLSFHEGVKAREIKALVEKMANGILEKSLAEGSGAIYFDTHDQIIRLFRDEINKLGFELTLLESKINPDKLPPESKDFADKMPKLYKVDLRKKMEEAA